MRISWTLGGIELVLVDFNLALCFATNALISLAISLDRLEYIGSLLGQPIPSPTRDFGEKDLFESAVDDRGDPWALCDIEPFVDIFRKFVTCCCCFAVWPLWGYCE